MKQIISLVAENQFGQIFITDTNEQRLQGILQEIPADHKVFRITPDSQVRRNEQDNHAEKRGPENRFPASAVCKSQPPGERAWQNTA